MMGVYIDNRLNKLLTEAIAIIESEWDYCPHIKELKRIKSALCDKEKE